MIAFAPTEEHALLLEAAQKLSKALAARVRETEKGGLSTELARAAQDLGVGSVHLPEPVGGAGLGLLAGVLLEEEIAAGDAAASLALGGTSVFALAMSELAPQGLAANAAAKSGAVAFGEPHPNKDRGGLSTVVRDNALHGDKAYVLGAEQAERFVVFAQVDESKGYEGIGAFLVERGAGVTLTPRTPTLGLDAASFAGLKLEGAKGTPLGAGKAQIVRFFAKIGLLNAARCVGLSRSALEVTRAYVEQRRAFGKPVSHFQAVAFTVADRAMDVEASRALVWRAAWLWDQGDEGQALLATARAISYAQEAAMRCGDDAVQLHGGAGFMRDYPVEKYMRDAKQLALYGLPVACADQLAAAIELGREPDLSLVLPWPDSQSAFL